MSPVRPRLEWSIGTVLGCVVALVIAYACSSPNAFSFESMRRDFYLYRSTDDSSPR